MYPRSCIAFLNCGIKYDLCLSVEKRLTVLGNNYVRFNCARNFRTKMHLRLLAMCYFRTLKIKSGAYLAERKYLAINLATLIPPITENNKCKLFNGMLSPTFYKTKLNEGFEFSVVLKAENCPRKSFWFSYICQFYFEVKYLSSSFI